MKGLPTVSKLSSFSVMGLLNSSFSAEVDGKNEKDQNEDTPTSEEITKATDIADHTASAPAFDAKPLLSSPFAGLSLPLPFANPLMTAGNGMPQFFAAFMAQQTAAAAMAQCQNGASPALLFPFMSPIAANGYCAGSAPSSPSTDTANTTMTSDASTESQPVSSNSPSMTPDVSTA
ncbi:hypothetical protein AAVH_25467 [Aphelenchoides avenae]|nr:hypothetical protein AAVH_25467 [Aphelenchus avenae]